MAYIVRTYAVMAYVVMACTVMAYIVTAYTVMAQGRKFDLRVWALIDQNMRVHVYREAVLRTCTAPFALVFLTSFRRMPTANAED